ncbi:hypothetical protein Mlute_02201 [Meiothermus luteus]|uniref:Uncharacterized protein n=1 Tax=Meiothermus luteus TaxID=2026184 RepID=A0A399EJ03_9DEIN|nr:hypothetical protein Mlute_02201 [Meiothermus luteus]
MRDRVLSAGFFQVLQETLLSPLVLALLLLLMG